MLWLLPSVPEDSVSWKLGMNEPLQQSRPGHSELGPVDEAYIMVNLQCCWKAHFWYMNVTFIVS